jgi:hypothetical protein
MKCRMCGAHRKARAGDLYCAGPADLCNRHYAEWFHTFDQALRRGASSDGAYREAITRLEELRVTA